MPHISLKAEKVFEMFGFSITNSLLSSYIFIIFFIIFSLIYRYKINYEKRSKFVFFVNFVLTTLYSLFNSITKEKTRIVFPFLASLFIFILFSNWLGLLPGVGSILIKHEHESFPLLRGATADLNMTFGLALVSICCIQYYGFKFLGIQYLKKYINLSNPINFFVGILEIFSELSKILSFSFRLFGNIFAGEVLLTVVATLIPILASFPFLLLELFVGLIQALVFSMLSAVFLNSALGHESH